MSEHTTVPEELRYPIGRVEIAPELSSAERNALIDRIADAPARLRAAVADLSSSQLDTRYRPGGWTVRQVVHHVPDSHLNGYLRFKQALTRDVPEVQSYDQPRWAETPEAVTAPPEVSLDLLDALHRRWVILLRAMSPADFGRRSQHPELGEVSLDALLQVYAWHGGHHTAHITNLREREDW